MASICNRRWLICVLVCVLYCLANAAHAQNYYRNQYYQQPQFYPNYYNGGYNNYGNGGNFNAQYGYGAGGYTYGFGIPYSGGQRNIPGQLFPNNSFRNNVSPYVYHYGPRGR